MRSTRHSAGHRTTCRVVSCSQGCHGPLTAETSEDIGAVMAERPAAVEVSGEVTASNEDQKVATEIIRRVGRAPKSRRQYVVLIRTTGAASSRRQHWRGVHASLSDSPSDGTQIVSSGRYVPVSQPCCDSVVNDLSIGLGLRHTGRAVVGK